MRLMAWPPRRLEPRRPKLGKGGVFPVSVVTPIAVDWGTAVGRMHDAPATGNKGLILGRYR